MAYGSQEVIPLSPKGQTVSWLDFMMSDHPFATTVYIDPWKTYLACVFGCVAMFYAIYLVFRMLKPGFYGKKALLHAAVWTLVPPLWFAFEYYILFKMQNFVSSDDFKARLEVLKQGQDIASKVWAAFAAVLGAYIAVYKDKDPGGAIPVPSAMPSAKMPDDI